MLRPPSFVTPIVSDGYPVQVDRLLVATAGRHMGPTDTLTNRIGKRVADWQRRLSHA